MKAIFAILNVAVASQMLCAEEPGTAEARINMLLREITISRIDFNQATITEIIPFLNGTAKEGDPEHKGFAMTMSLEKGMPRLPESEVPPVSLRLHDLPLGVALDYITRSVGLNYHVTANGVEIVPPSPQGSSSEWKIGKDWSAMQKSNYKKMRSILVNKADFRQATIQEVIEFFRQASIEGDIPSETGKKEGINFVFFASGDEPPITVKLFNVSLGYLLDQVTEQCHEDYQIEPYAVVISPASSQKSSTVRKEREDRAEQIKQMQEKLKSISVAKLEFHRANLQEVQAFLRDASVEGDTADPATKRKEGVNFILNLPADSEIAVTYSNVHVSLHDALDFICTQTGLKWRVDGYAVVLEK